MNMLSQVLIYTALWGVLSVIVCITIAKYIIEKTDKEEMAFLVFPIWALFSMLALGIYLNLKL